MSGHRRPPIQRSGWGRLTYFEILGPPPYLGNGWRYKRQIWHADSPPGLLTKEIQN